MDGRGRTFPFVRRRRGERGQTLLFGLIAIVILVVAIFVLFDLQTVIRFKVKAQTAVDAAALTAAKWQKDSLNLIGEINLVKACTVIISDGAFGIGGDPDTYVDRDSNTWDALNAAKGPLDQMAAAYGILTQMQVRLSFVGPLIGIGAAQQAAKNNGLDYSQSYSNGAVWAYKNVRDGYDADHGLSMIYPANYSWGYDWKPPYQALLADLIWGTTSADDSRMSYAFAVNPNKKMGVPQVYFDPDDPHIPAGPFNSANFYANCFSVNPEGANTGWCFLLPFRTTTFDELWWKRMKVRMAWSFPYESEYCPLQVSFEGGPAYNSSVSSYIDAEGRDLVPLSKTYDNYDPRTTIFNTYRLDANGRRVRPEYSNTGNLNDTDGKYSPFGSLPQFTWCIYDMGGDTTSTSASGSSVTWNRWDTCTDSNKPYLYGYDETMRGPTDQKLKPEYAYKSGAFAFMGATFPDSGQHLWLGNMTVKSGGGSENAVIDPNAADYRSSVLGYDRYQDRLGTTIKSNLYKLDSSERSYLQFTGQNTSDLYFRTAGKYVATAVAKPMGRIPVKGSGAASEYLQPCSTSLILPVFDNVCLVPKFFPDFTFTSQSPPGTDFFSDPDFYNFLLYCIPEIQDESITSLETLVSAMPGIMARKHPDIWNPVVRRYFDALVVFIQLTQVWEETFKPWLVANVASCRSWSGTGPGQRYHPASP